MRSTFIGQGSDQILGRHLLPALRREQRQLRNRSVATPLFWREQSSNALLLQSITEHMPRREPLFLSERRQSTTDSVLIAELSPVSQPRRLALVG